MDRDERLLGSAQHIAASFMSRVQNITHLHSLSVKDSTLSVYSVATMAFADWLGQQRLSVSTLPELDDTLALYIALLYDDDPRRGTRQTAVNTYAGLEFFFPAVEKGFRTARRAIRGWDNTVPAKPPLPISQCILEAVCGQLLHRNKVSVALAICVAFSGYLRAMELLNLRRADVLFPQDPRQVSSGSGEEDEGLIISVSKTGTNQFVVISDRSLLQGLDIYCSTSRLSADDYLFPFTYTQFHTEFRLALSSIGLKPDQFTLHSIRHGGATSDLLKGVTFEDIQQKGRWVSAKSCKRYLNAGSGLMALISLSDLSKRHISRYQRYFALARVGWTVSRE